MNEENSKFIRYSAHLILGSEEVCGPPGTAVCTLGPPATSPVAWVELYCTEVLCASNFTGFFGK